MGKCNNCLNGSKRFPSNEFTQMTPTEFEEAVLGAFAFLVKDFGFRYVVTSMHAPECWSVFHNATTAVIVHYELGSRPWVEVAELKHDGNRIVERHRSALDFLVQERAPHEARLTA